ncbi:hypothetical protein RI367_003564 [Sorochytrium milnesiophthora]
MSVQVVDDGQPRPTAIRFIPPSPSPSIAPIANDVSGARLATSTPATAHKSSTTWEDLDSASYMGYGSLFVLTVDSAMYPFEVLRTRMQADTVSGNGSIVQMLRRIVKLEGVAKLYRGIGAAVFGSFPGQATYFSTYEFSQVKYAKMLSTWFPDSSGLASHAMAGLTAELASAAFYVPSDMVSQRLQTQPVINFFHARQQYSSAYDVVRHVYQTSGVLGFYRGYLPHILAFAPSSAIYWCTYELSKRTVCDRAPQLDGLAANALSASVAATCSVFVSNPFDVLRTRIQTHERMPTDKTDIWGLARSIVRKEGFLRGFYKGLQPRLFMAVPGSIITLSGYEAVKKWSRSDSATN